MKKKSKTSAHGKKLGLSSETLRNLTASELMHAEGGSNLHHGSTLHIGDPGQTILGWTITTR